VRSSRCRLSLIIPRWSARSSSCGIAKGPSSGCATETAAARSSGSWTGPITANNPAGVHHGHGRTLKDVFQRYKAFRGFDERYQNGFDCQGLHVEVESRSRSG
jgi:hypothetical protein